MSEITVLHIASWYPNPQDERLGNFVEEHLKAISTQQKVVVLSAFEGDRAEVELRESPFLQVQVLYRKKWPLWSHYQALKKGYAYLLNQGHHFDMAHLHICWPSGLAFLGFLKNLPFIVTEHYSGYQSRRRHEWSRSAQFFARAVMNKAALICPVSQQLGQSLSEFGVRRPQSVVGNVVDGSLFKHQSPPPAVPFRLLHISSLQEETKNIKGLLRGFKAALDQDSELVLSIGGDGAIDELKANIGAANIPQENIRILSAMNRREVAEEIAASHAFLLFSFIENQPVVLLESLCVGRPVISSKVGGIAEFIGPEEGLLVPSKDEAQLASSILKMKADYAQYDSKAIAEKAAKTHSFQAIAQRFMDCYTIARPSNP